MSSFLALVKKEISSYFLSPIAYVVLTVFLLLSGYFFFSLTAEFNIQSMHYMRYQGAGGVPEISVNNVIIRPLFYNMSIVLLLIVPLFTMRMYAEEKKSGTLELLKTGPVSNTSLTLAKYLGSLAVFLIMLVLTAFYPVILSFFGNPDIGPIATGYLGLALMGGVFIAVGSLVSSFTENQIIAAVATFGTLLLLWVISWAKHFVGPVFGEILSYFSIIEHYADFAKGIVDTKDVIFYLTFMAGLLFLTRQSLEMN
ncbi:MAG: ABC transporter permease [bacterium]